MTAFAIRPQPAAPTAIARPAAIAAGVLTALIAAAMLRQLSHGAPLLPGRNAWLALHLATVIPALPLGGYVLLRRKGDRLHRMLGRTWALMMIGAALSSFGLHGLTGRVSWIHILSVVVLVTVPRGVMQAVRGDIRAHQRSMTLTYAGLVSAGAFTFLPGRLLGTWLFG